MQERTPETATAATHAEAYGTPQREYKHYASGEEHRDKELTWHVYQSREDRNPYETQQTSATSTHSQTDEQIGEALRRAAAQGHDSDWTNASPDGDDRSLIYGGGSATNEHPSDSMLHHDPKKRKRNFSNRTKTGCFTCRKRKKKCDEQKPECKKTRTDAWSTRPASSAY